jgi:hypothetical protein
MKAINRFQALGRHHKTKRMNKHICKIVNNPQNNSDIKTMNSEHKSPYMYSLKQLLTNHTNNTHAIIIVTITPATIPKINIISPRLNYLRL